MWSPKLAIGAWVVGAQADRYVPKGYREFVAPEEKIRRVASIPDVTGIELTYPVDFLTMPTQELAGIIKENNLVVSDIGVNIFGNPKWKHGSFTNRQKDVRQEAIDTALQAVEAAKAVGAGGLRMWMGQDGFDYPFQADYKLLWDLMIDGLREVANAAPELRFGIEYKLKEPRTHSLIDGVSKSILFAQELKAKNAGVIIDFGHSLMGKENAAEAAYQALRYNMLSGVHFNDAYGDWDDDMIPGTLNLFESLEFLYILRDNDYKGWLTLDSFPFREDPVKAVDLSMRNVKAMIKMANTLDIKALKEAQKTMDAVATQEIARKMVFKD